MFAVSRMSLFFSFHNIITWWFLPSRFRVGFSSSRVSKSIFFFIWSLSRGERFWWHLCYLYWPLFSWQLVFLFLISLNSLSIWFSFSRVRIFSSLVTLSQRFWQLMTCATSSRFSLMIIQILFCKHFSPWSSLGAAVLSFSPHLIRKYSYRSPFLLEGCQRGPR